MSDITDEHADLDDLHGQDDPAVVADTLTPMGGVPLDLRTRPYAIMPKPPRCPAGHEGLHQHDAYWRGKSTAEWLAYIDRERQLKANLPRDEWLDHVRRIRTAGPGG